MFSIRRVEDAATVVAGSGLFDNPVTGDAARGFLDRPGHHLLMAFEDDQPRQPLGFVSGVETSHPDKGTELFLYELSVAASARGRGIGTALVAALRELAQERDCYGMWVATAHDNEAAQRAYRRAGATDDGSFAMLTWTFQSADEDIGPLAAD